MRIEQFFGKDGKLKQLQESKGTFDAEIKDGDGKVLFSLQGIEAPIAWSNQAVNIVASKYFWKGDGNGHKPEKSVYDMVHRVARAITKSGSSQGYFSSDEDAHRFYEELSIILLGQMAAFNSPVWFNVGIHEKPQCSACFINSVGDNMESITDLAKTEMLLFKYGSGTGTNFSTLRSSKEWSTKGGFRSSGPVSFMKGYDAFAGIIKSGGKTRRAAKMVILNDNHPDIREFINCKMVEEKKAHALIKAGFEAAFNKPGGAYDSVGYQNANHSVRISDEFMECLEKDGEWELKGILNPKEVIDRIRARELWEMICESTWQCGDPGIQFDGAINKMHTCKESGRINASNPCSEYMFLDDSACNLASLNLLKFFKNGGRTIWEEFDDEAYEQAVKILIIAMDILVDMSSYPTPAIAKNSHEYRPLGLGYANLGALLMCYGIPYDSIEAGYVTNQLTGRLTGHAYVTSGEIAEELGPFEGFEKNKASMIEVFENHDRGKFYYKVTENGAVVKQEGSNLNWQVWDDVLFCARNKGIRNSQISVLAPTGTIAFMMDCDTTGIEPDLALVKKKKLVGGGHMTIVNQSVGRALKYLGYMDHVIESILKNLVENGGNIELAAPMLKGKEREIFDCAYPAPGSKRFLHWRAHLNIMAAAQPFISGAISKTVNVPEETTREQIGEIYKLAWHLGLKSVALYRENCKKSQPLSKEDGEKVVPKNLLEGAIHKERKRLPDERQSITHKFSVGGHEGYVHVGLYSDGQPGEVFITIAKEGSTISGLLDGLATLTSIALQHGVPLETLISKFRGQKFEPSGFTNNEKIRIATSITDYIFRWLGHKFVAGFESKEIERHLGVDMGRGKDENVSILAGHPLVPVPAADFAMDAPMCPNCGSLTVRAGTCHSCPTCGTQTGCA